MQVLDFLTECHLCAVGILRSAPQELTQSDDHAHCGFVPMFTHQAGDRVQRIEHEVRLHLLPQRCQLRLGEFVVEARGLGDVAGHALA